MTQTCACVIFMAGSKYDGWHPLVRDFILVGRKLEKLGFIYSKGGVIVVQSEDVG